MTISQDWEALKTESEWEEIKIPPGDLESEEPPGESYLHLQQIILLLQCLDWLWRDKTDYFAAGNLSIYYNPEPVKTKDFRGLDFFVVMNS